MRTFETKVEINARPEAVWAVLSNVVEWHEWTPTIRRVEPLDQIALAAGGRYRVSQPRLQPAIWSVTEVSESPSEMVFQFQWVTRKVGLTLVADHRIEPHGNGRTLLTLRIALEGFLSGIAGYFNQRLIESSIQLEARSLADWFPD